MSNSELAILFSLQLAVILGICRIVGFLSKKIGQPQVVGEMIAGVLLGLRYLVPCGQIGSTSSFLVVLPWGYSLPLARLAWYCPCF